MQQLTQNHRVVGLPRKAKNGTSFQIHNTRPNVAIGFARVFRTLKDGTVIAKLDGTNLQVTFNTKDKTVWPDAVPATRFAKVS